MKRTQSTLDRYLVNTRVKFGVKAYDDFAEKITFCGYGKTVKGIVAAVLKCAGWKKYQKVIAQLVPQLRDERYLADVIRVALWRVGNRNYERQTTVTELIDELKVFNLSRSLVERYLRGFAEVGEIKAVELQSGLENIYL